MNYEVDNLVFNLDEIANRKVKSVMEVKHADVAGCYKTESGAILIPAEVDIRDSFTDSLDICEEDRGYINRFGFQAFGIDRFILNDKIDCRRFQSDYNTFWALRCSDEFECLYINAWESVFWPTAFDSFCDKFRQKCNKAVIDTMKRDTFELAAYIIYTPKVIILCPTGIGVSQFDVIFTLAKFYLVENEIDEMLSNIKSEDVRNKYKHLRLNRLYEKKRVCPICGGSLNSNGVCTNILCEGDTRKNSMDEAVNESGFKTFTTSNGSIREKDDKECADIIKRKLKK